MKSRELKFAVAGLGYVGLSLAVLLSQKYDVIAYDILNEKVDSVNRRVSPIRDELIEFFLSREKLRLEATSDEEQAYKDADFVIVAVPTDYDTTTNVFDTAQVESTVRTVLKYNSQAMIVIKSTIPVGFTDGIRAQTGYDRIIFSPEFLRESKALYDNLYPSRIIVGANESNAADGRLFAECLAGCAIKKDIPILLISAKEAECVKLFSNAYLAMRVAYFNELDTYAEVNGLDSREIITGVCLDSRIGNYYNNPSFGYGGYCLPKDTKQLKSNFGGIPQNIISAIVDSNDTRKTFVANRILKRLNELPDTGKPRTVGVYRLIMKANSDNFRQSAIFDVIEHLQSCTDVDIIIYEPTLDLSSFNGIRIIKDADTFFELSDIIISNRIDANLTTQKEKIYSRDIFGGD